MDNKLPKVPPLQGLSQLSFIYHSFGVWDTFSRLTVQFVIHTLTHTIVVSMNYCYLYTLLT
jgi:hypothetical protein